MQRFYATSVMILCLTLGAPAGALAQGAEDSDAGVPAIENAGTAGSEADAEAPASPEVPATHPETTSPEATTGAPEAEPVDTPVETVNNPAEAAPADTGRELWSKFQTRDWLGVLAGVLMFLIWLLRKFAGKLSGWFNTKMGGYSLSFGTAFVLTFAIARWAGTGFSMSLVTTAFGAALAASGGRKGLKDFISWMTDRAEDKPAEDEAPAKSEG